MPDALHGPENLAFGWDCGINWILPIDVFEETEREIMPKACEICGKGPVFGQSLSHSHKASKKKWDPNLQRIKAVSPSGGTKRIWVCTRCLRSGKVKKAV